MKAITKGPFLIVDVLRILCAFLLPPLSVVLTVGFTRQFWLNVVLTLLGYLPGMVHAIWLLTACAAAAPTTFPQPHTGPLRSRRIAPRRFVARRAR